MSSSDTPALVPLPSSDAILASSPPSPNIQPNPPTTLPAIPEIDPQKRQQPPPTSSSGWGGGWFSLQDTFEHLVDTVKKQSEVVVDVYKRDLTEFAHIVATESTHLLPFTNASQSRSEQLDDETGGALPIVESTYLQTSAVETHGESSSLPSDTRTSLFGRFSAGLSSLLAEAVSVTPDPETPSRKTIVYDRRSALIDSIRKDPATYLRDPSGSDTPSETLSPVVRERSQRYAEFRGRFSLPVKANEISRVLSEHAVVARLLGRIVVHAKPDTFAVPAEVSYEDFWARYFFALEEMEFEEKTRRRLIAAHDVDAEAVPWDSDEEVTEQPPDEEISIRDDHPTSDTSAIALTEATISAELSPVVQPEEVALANPKVSMEYSSDGFEMIKGVPGAKEEAWQDWE